MPTETIGKTPNQNSLANLKPHWVEGQSGNPNGRPRKEFSLTEAMREFIAEDDPDRKKARKDILVEKTYQMAQRGDISAIKEIWNRLEGLPAGSAPNVNVAVVNQTPLTDEDKLDYSIRICNQFSDKIESVDGKLRMK